MARWYPDTLAGVQVLDLGFLEVRHDPQIVDRHDVEHGDAKGDKPSDPDLAIADDTGHGCMDDRAVEVDPGEITGGLGLSDGGDSGLPLGAEHRDTLVLGLDCCGGGRQARLGTRTRGVALVDLRLADRAAADELAATVGHPRRQVQFRHR